MNFTQSGSYINGTYIPADPSLFLDYEKAFVGLVPALVLVVGTLLYKYVRRPSTGEDDTDESRLLPLYTVSAGIMWGQFFMHVFPNATTYGELGYKFRSLFFLVGYSCMVGYERFSRTSHDNRNFVGQSVATNVTSFTLRKDQDIEADYVEMHGNSSGAPLWDASDESLVFYRRRVAAHIYYFMIAFHCLVDGLFLVFNAAKIPHLLLILVFATQKVLESVALFTVLIHARLYTTRGAKKRWFFVLLLGWPLIVLASTMIALSGVNVDTASAWINHAALGTFYSIFAGTLLWFANHFEKIEPAQPTRRQLRLSFLFWNLTALLLWGTGWFV